MQVSVRRAEDVLVVAVSGKIIGEASVQLRRTFDRLLKEVPEGSTPRLVLNLSAVTFLDSQGLGVLVRARQAIVQRGGKMALAAAPPNIARLLTVAKLSGVLPLYAEESDAVAALGPDRKGASSDPAIQAP